MNCILLDLVFCCCLFYLYFLLDFYGSVEPIVLTIQQFDLISE